MGFLERGLLLYLCLAIAMAFSFPTIIFGTNEQGRNMLSFFGINAYDNVTGEPIINGTITYGDTATQNQLLKQGVDVTPSTFQFFIDVVKNTIGYIVLFFKVILSPFIIFYTAVTSFGMPLPLLFMFALPMVLLFLLGIIYFLRSGG